MPFIGEKTIIIVLERTGGFTGLKVKTQIDTDAIAAEQASEILSLVGDADFFALPASIPPPARGADRFQYQLTITDGERQHSVLADESEQLSAPLRALIGKVTEIARNHPSR